MKSIFPIFLCLLALSIPLSSFAAHLVVSKAEITTVRIYERADGSTNSYIGVNNRKRVGPNPNGSGVDCELWTNTDQVFTTALAAKVSGQKVNIKYRPRGDNNAACVVTYLEIIE